MPSSATYEVDQDQYRCPHGMILPRRKANYSERVITFQAAAETCHACPLKAKCTESDRGRMIKRSFDEPYLERVRAYHATEAYKKAIRKRKVWVEPLFGEAKAWHGLARFRLRRLEKVTTEAVLIAAGQNLKRLLSWRGWGRRWWPGGAVGVVVPSPFCAHSWIPAEISILQGRMRRTFSARQHAHTLQSRRFFNSSS